MTTHPSYFFDCKNYAHAELFEEITHAWESLEKLVDYLPTYRGVLTHPTPSTYPGVHFENVDLIYLGDNVQIEPGAYIRGPCVIGKESIIRHGAYIRGNVVTGSHCVIGHGTEIKSSILLDRAHAAHFNYIGNSILGNDVNLGAGVKCANYRLDQKNIYVRMGEEKIDTGLKKLGAIVGDGVQIGCNCVINPGALLSPGVLSLPSQTLKGFISKDTYLTQFIPP